MEKTLQTLRATVDAALPRLRQIAEEQAARRPAQGKWSPKELLGHLIDSASNNHQRFVRAQLAPALTFPPYEQEGWVSVQGYQQAPWADLVELWRVYNRHLLHVMSRVPAERLSTPCTIGPNEPGNLGDLMRDYVVHLEHHLGQVLGQDQIG